MQIRQLIFKRYEGVTGAGNITRAASPGRLAKRSVSHGGADFLALPHAKIIVGTPDGDISRAVWAMPHRHGMPSCNPFQFNKMPIAILTFERVYSLLKGLIVTRSHSLTPSPRSTSPRAT